MPVADSVIQYVPLGGKLTNVIKARQETYHKLKIKRKELIHSKRMSKNCDTIAAMYCMFKGNIISKNENILCKYGKEFSKIIASNIPSFSENKQTKSLELNLKNG